MDTNTIVKYKDILESTRDSLLRQVHALKKDQCRENGAISADFAEQVVDVENDEVVDGILQNDSNTLSLINSALIRMDNGTYGECLTCGEAIEKARLEAIPYASTCMACAS